MNSVRLQTTKNFTSSMNLKRYYSTREIADLLGLTIHQVYKRIDRDVGRHNGVKTKWRFTKEDIEKIKQK